MNKDLKYITFIPLIGGMAIANYQATGKKPEFVLSYEPFQKNEAHLKNYWDDVEWHLLDPETNTTDEELDYTDIDFALIMGSEGKGISKTLLNKADFKVKIPTNFESLNVSNAAAVIIYEAVRQILKKS